MEDVNKVPEERKKVLHDLLLFVEKLEGNNTGVGQDSNSREQQKNNAQTSQQEPQVPQDVTQHSKTAQQQQNQYEIGKTDTGTNTAATGMTYMPSIRELGYLHQTSMLKKDFKIREVISYARQND